MRIGADAAAPMADPEPHSEPHSESHRGTAAASTDTAVPAPASAGERAPSRGAWIVDAGFLALLIACAIRYSSIHSFSDGGGIVLALAISAGLAYLASALGRPSAVRAPVGVLLSTALWIPLVLLAPSFGWVAFALFFAVHRVLSRRLARWGAVIIVLTVCVGTYTLSRGADPGLLLGPLLGGIVLTVVYEQLGREMEHRRRLIEQLVRTRAELAQSERDAGALAERTRVASELHDTVVQHTATALLLLETVDRPEPEIGEARDVLRSALVETRQLMHGLAATSGAAAGAHTLGTMLADVAARFGATFVQVDGPRDLPDETAHALLRIAQESLANAAKHASATQVSVTLTYFADEVGIDIVDDGIGVAEPMPGDAESAGYGLRAMAWRAESLGGSFALESQPGQGTTVSAIVPATLSGGDT